jgi:hypothetical protein
VKITVPDPVDQFPTPVIVKDPTQLDGFAGLMMQPTNGRMLLTLGDSTFGVVGLVSPLAFPRVGAAGRLTIADIVPTAV